MLAQNFDPLLAQLPVAIILGDEQGQISDCNPLAEQWLQMSPALLHKPMHTVEHPLFSWLPSDWLARIFRGEILHHQLPFQQQILKLQLQTLPANSQAHAWLLAAREYCVIPETQADLRLAASVFDSNINAILITDAEGIIQRINPAYT